MPILVHPICKRVVQSAGFTLIELLVVLVIAGIALGLVSLNALPSSSQILQNDARRLALLLQVARDEAIVRNQAVAVEVTPTGYQFLTQVNQQWQILSANQDDLLRARTFAQAPLQLALQPRALSTAPLHIVFGREPVDQAFAMQLAADQASVTIRADGIGHFVVE